MGLRAVILAAFLTASPLFGWEVRLFDVRPGLVLPRSGAVPQSWFDQARSASPLAVFHLQTGEEASTRLFEPAETFSVRISPRASGGDAVCVTVTVHDSVHPAKGASKIHHLVDYLYVVRPIPERPVLVQFVP